MVEKAYFTAIFSVFLYGFGASPYILSLPGV